MTDKRILVLFCIIICYTFSTPQVLCANDSSNLSFVVVDDNETYAMLYIENDLYRVDQSGDLVKIDDEKQVEMSLGTAYLGMMIPISKGALGYIIKAAPILWKSCNKEALRFMVWIKNFYYSCRVSRVEVEIIKKSKIIKVNNRSVSTRDGIIKHKNRCYNEMGGLINNCELMSKGNAPLGPDCRHVNLHHSMQNNDGLLVELTASEHQDNAKDLHSYKQESEVARGQFNSWKPGYWKERWQHLCP